MKVKSARSDAHRRGEGGAAQVHFPLEASVGYQIRMVYRAMQKLLQGKIEPHGVTLGMWYYLRALWSEDGLTQSELSRRIGTMEPTTLGAIQAMERSGLVKRVRSKDDRRKVHIHLTRKGRELEAMLMPLAVDVVDTSVAGFSRQDVDLLLESLRSIRDNIEAGQANAAASDAERDLSRGA
jgi:MarR family transcriptional regulator, organic hydroperoxide resistance regulator